MAYEFDKSVDSKRTSSYSIPPESLRVSPDINGRHDLPDVEWLIADILKNGQTHPIVIRNDGGFPVIVDGHCRWRAISAINERHLTPVPLRVQCVGFTGNEVDAFKAAIRTNHFRYASTPMDDAYNIDRLFKYGMTAEEIAVFYFPVKKGDKPNVAWVTSRHALISLTPEAGAEVAAGKIKVTAAVAIAKLSAKQQREMLAKKEKITGADIRAASGKPSKPTFKQVREELDSIISEWAARLPSEVNELLAALRDKI